MSMLYILNFLGCQGEKIIFLFQSLIFCESKIDPIHQSKVQGIIHDHQIFICLTPQPIVLSMFSLGLKSSVMSWPDVKLVPEINKQTVR